MGWPRSPGVGDPGPARSAPRESADKVVLHTGKYEELIVCSHEIAASTAQLVAASKVRLCPARPLLRFPTSWLRWMHRMWPGDLGMGRSHGGTLRPDPPPRSPR